MGIWSYCFPLHFLFQHGVNVFFSCSFFHFHPFCHIFSILCCLKVPRLLSSSRFLLIFCRSLHQAHSSHTSGSRHTTDRLQPRNPLSPNLLEHIFARCPCYVHQGKRQIPIHSISIDHACPTGCNALEDPVRMKK